MTNKYQKRKKYNPSKLVLYYLLIIIISHFPFFKSLNIFFKNNVQTDCYPFLLISTHNSLYRCIYSIMDCLYASVYMYDSIFIFLCRHFCMKVKFDFPKIQVLTIFYFICSAREMTSIKNTTTISLWAVLVVVTVSCTAVYILIMILAFVIRPREETGKILVWTLRTPVARKHRKITFKGKKIKKVFNHYTPLYLFYFFPPVSM